MTGCDDCNKNICYGCPYAENSTNDELYEDLHFEQTEQN